MAERIAEFAIERRVDVVLAPTRLLDEDPKDKWLAIDIETCQALRTSLDELGAKAVSVDYPLLTTYQTLLDVAARRALISQIKDLPFDHLWLRIANFGSDKSAAGVRKYIDAARDLHEIGRAIIADGVGGLPALGIVAFGAAGGICHGVAEKERFYPSYWRRPRDSGGGGPATRIYFDLLDAYLNVGNARTLLATLSAKPLLGCRDTGCCPDGWGDTILNPRRHYLIRTTRRVQALGRVPDSRREDHFLSKQLAPVDRAARTATRLKVPNKQILERLSRISRKTDEMRRVLEELHVTDHNRPRSRIPEKRADQWRLEASTGAS